MKASVPEWSKGAVSRTAIERCVGSNPTGCIFCQKIGRIKEEKRRQKGDVAHMVEHSLRMRGARGSIPLISIKFLKERKV